MNRIKWMDLARTLAIFFVIVLHVTDTFLSKLDLDKTEWIIYQSERILGRLSVPYSLCFQGL